MALSIALVAVSAWIVIPLGPVPFTMQMYMITLVICLLRPKEAVAAIFGYVALGAIGVPLFSGMRGGAGVLLGPTGGFLLGYLIGVPLAVGFLALMKKRFRVTAVLQFIAGVIFTVVAYGMGTLQYMALAGIGLEAALATSVLPFIVPDLVKIAFAVASARIIHAALGSRT